MFPDICFVSSDKIEQFPDRHVWIDSNLHHLAANVKIKFENIFGTNFCIGYLHLSVLVL